MIDVLDDTLPADSAPSSGRRGFPPALLSRYEDVSFLAEGGAGAIYRARDPRLGRSVAIKLLKNHAPQSGRRFLQEARTQARVEHEGVCRVYEAGEADGEPFIVMQLVDGEPLGRASARMSLEQKARVVRDIAAAVHEAHRLGLIHRDIKPGNILVERREDGSFKPYIVDFGIAREVLQEGHTTTGALMGTPAYMAPEQALPGTRALDRRTDVYGLGAALYDAIAGRPPFVDDHPWKIVVRIATEDPRDLRALLPSVPRDLAAIVMKCMARDPARRYDSARALGEDLQRFLDGEPVLATRARLSARLVGQLRRHRLLAAAVALGLGAAAVPTAMWARARRDADTQARLSQELGHDVAEMEHLMRSAYQMPLHDIERERALVRARLAKIERRMEEAGPRAIGPGHYALGRGLLAVGDVEQAYDHLERARAAGYTPPALDYALGTALIDIYHLSQWRAAQAQDAAERGRRQQLTERYRDEALVRLRAAGPAQLEAPAYAAALLALHEDRPEEAAIKAREAFARSPLLFEAKRLEGDALSALASRAWAEGKPGWWERMSAHVDASAAAYRAAEDTARSDPRVHEGACWLWTKAMFAANFQGHPRQPAFELAREACDRFLVNDPSNPRLWFGRAELHALYAFALSTNPGHGEAPEEAVAAAIRAVEDALARSRAPDLDASLREKLGTALRARAALEVATGRDARGTLERARAIYDDLRRDYPAVPTAYSSLALVDRLTLVLERWRGVDVEPTLEQGLGRLDTGLSLGDSPAMVSHKRGTLLLEHARQLLERGQSPRPAVDLALAEAQAGEALYAEWGGFAGLRAQVHSIEAAHAIDAGGDPRRALEEARREALRLLEREPSTVEGQRLLGGVALQEARHALREGRSPERALAEARARFQAAIDGAPWCMEPRQGLARAELLAARWAVARRRATPATFEAARAPLAPGLTGELADPELHELLAESHALAAAWRGARGESPEQDVAEGLARCDRALARNPRHAAALAIQEQLRRLLPDARRRER